MLQMEFSHDKANVVIKDLETLFASLLEDLIKELIYFMGNFDKQEYQQPVSQDNLVILRNGVRTNLDNLNYTVEELIIEVLNKNIEILEEHLTDVYLDIFEDQNTLIPALQNKWCGTNFKDVLTEGTRQYLYKIKKELNAGLIRGDSKAQLKNTITKLITSFSKKINTIVSTETSYMNNQATLDKASYEGYKKVRINEILDKKTCGFCKSRDGEEVLLKDVKFGTNIPPFHPYCRGFIEFM